MRTGFDFQNQLNWTSENRNNNCRTKKYVERVLSVPVNGNGRISVKSVSLYDLLKISSGSKVAIICCMFRAPRNATLSQHVQISLRKRPHDIIIPSHSSWVWRHSQWSMKGLLLKGWLSLSLSAPSKKKHETFDQETLRCIPQLDDCAHENYPIWCCAAAFQCAFFWKTKKGNSFFRQYIWGGNESTL